MPYSTDVAMLIANQLNRFITLNRQQLAGQVANLDFWLNEVRHALAILDGYGVRFARMETAQLMTASRAIPEHEGRAVYKVSKPHRIPEGELQKPRRHLIEAVTRFLDRCHREGLIAAEQLESALSDFR